MLPSPLYVTCNSSTKVSLVVFIGNVSIVLFFIVFFALSTMFCNRHSLAIFQIPKMLVERGSPISTSFLNVYQVRSLECTKQL